jgi:hypothetical protein
MPLFALCLGAPLLLLLRRRWVARAYQLLLLGAIAVWIKTGWVLIDLRISTQAPWLRLTLIFAFVIVLNLIAMYIFETPKMKSRYASLK